MSISCSFSKQKVCFILGSGGGSGGSVWITTNLFKGHGEISSVGGLGNNYGSALGGSGAGGRIAVHMGQEDEFRGSYSPHGGAGTGSRQGGPGTVYIEERRGLFIHSRLYVDNMNANPVKEFIMKEKNPREDFHKRVEGVLTDYHFDEFMLLNNVSWNVGKVFVEISLLRMTVYGISCGLVKKSSRGRHRHIDVLSTLFYKPCFDVNQST